MDNNWLMLSRQRFLDQRHVFRIFDVLDCFCVTAFVPVTEAAECAEQYSFRWLNRLGGRWDWVGQQAPARLKLSL
jgi:hypothetical protein